MESLPSTIRQIEVAHVDGGVELTVRDSEFRQAVLVRMEVRQVPIACIYKSHGKTGHGTMMACYGLYISTPYLFYECYVDELLRSQVLSFPLSLLGTAWS